MEKEENLSAAMAAGAFSGLEYSLDLNHQKPQFGESSTQMVDYMLHNPPQQPISCLDKLSFADVMQFADFGPKSASINHDTRPTDEETGMDPVYFLKFPVLNDKLQGDEDEGDGDGDGDHQGLMMVPHEEGNGGEDGGGGSESRAVRLGTLGEKNQGKTKRKRARSVKTSEEVESQRMTHIAVERNRRKQMNEHLRVLRSLMPGSYVQRGDQASIIGGAIEFVRELEQLLQCLESQKRRRLYGDSSMGTQQQQPPPQSPFALPLGDDEMKLVDYETGLQEETGESKSGLADVEVKLFGFDAMIKILSRRRAGQLIQTIAALEDMQLNILHTNITTIEHTVLYSFNVKVAGEARCTAQDIANSIQQIFTFIHANQNT